jgi:hypothetical protein
MRFSVCLRSEIDTDAPYFKRTAFSPKRDVNTRKLVISFRAHFGPIRNVHPFPYGSDHIVSCGDDNMVRARVAHFPSVHFPHRL